MNSRRLVLTIGLLAAVALAKEHHMLDFTSVNNGFMTQRAIVGDFIHIKLAENPSTGYTWHALQRESDEEINLFFEGEKFFKNKDQSNDEEERFMAGKGGFKIMKFQANKVGKFNIDMVLAKSWELDEFKDERGFLQWEKV